MAQARQREVEEDRPSKNVGGGEVVMVGGMDALVGNANEEVTLQMEDTEAERKAKKPVEIGRAHV